MPTASDVDWDAPYRAPLADFVAARQALVARLKALGARERMSVAKALAKPTATAWCVNQVHWQAPALLTTLVAAGHALRRAQGNASGSDLRAAMGARREALSEARARALAFLSAEGHAVTPAVEQRVSDTLLALASHGEELPGGLRLGCLTQDLAPPGFEALAGLTLAPRPDPVDVPNPMASERAAPAVVQPDEPSPAALAAARLVLAAAEHDCAQAEHEWREAQSALATAERAQAEAGVNAAALEAQLADLQARLTAVGAQRDQALLAQALAQRSSEHAQARVRAAQVALEQQQARRAQAEGAVTMLCVPASDAARS
jgi:hypothetical protein